MEGGLLDSEGRGGGLRYWVRAGGAGGAVAAVGLGMRKGDGRAGVWGGSRRTVLCFFRSHTAAAAAERSSLCSRPLALFSISSS